MTSIWTPLGHFRRVSNDPFTPFVDTWQFECPRCGEWAYLDEDQWNGRVSVDHAVDGCPGNYHETHDYKGVLLKTLRHE